MPAFGEDGLLTPEEIDTVSIYVAKNAGKVGIRIMIEFLNMDGYGIYIWPAYILRLV